jgi:hypothetical protein
MNRNRIDLWQWRQGAWLKSTDYLGELCGLARKLFVIKCKEFILNVLFNLINLVNLNKLINKFLYENTSC